MQVQKENARRHGVSYDSRHHAAYSGVYPLEGGDIYIGQPVEGRNVPGVPGVPEPGPPTQPVTFCPIVKTAFLAASDAE